MAANYIKIKRVAGWQLFLYMFQIISLNIQF